MASIDLSLLEQNEPWDWPEGAGEVLLEVLADAKVSLEQRRLAALLAAETMVMDDAIASALVAIIGDGDQDEELRCQAALSLGPALEEADLDSLASAEDLGLGEYADLEDALLSPKILDEMKGVLRTIHRDEGNPVGLRRRALEAAVRSPEDWQSEAVKTAYSSGDPLWRLTAVFCMRFIPGFDAEILESLDSDDDELLFEAVLAAGVWCVDDAWDRVTKLLNQGDDRDLLLAAIEALPQIRPDEAELLLSPLLSHQDEEIVEAVTEVLALCGGEDFDEDADFEDDLDDRDDKHDSPV